MKKIAFFLTLAVMIFVTACGSSPESKIEKLKGMADKQTEIAKDKGATSKEAIDNYGEMIKYSGELMSAAESDNWTTEQKAELLKVLASPVDPATTAAFLESGDAKAIEAMMDQYKKLEQSVGANAVKAASEATEAATSAMKEAMGE